MKWGGGALVNTRVMEDSVPCFHIPEKVEKAVQLLKEVPRFPPLPWQPVRKQLSREERGGVGGSTASEQTKIVTGAPTETCREPPPDNFDLENFAEGLKLKFRLRGGAAAVARRHTTTTTPHRPVCTRPHVS